MLRSIDGSYSNFNFLATVLTILAIDIGSGLLAYDPGLSSKVNAKLPELDS